MQTNAIPPAHMFALAWTREQPARITPVAGHTVASARKNAISSTGWPWRKIRAAGGAIVPVVVQYSTDPPAAPEKRYAPPPTDEELRVRWAQRVPMPAACVQ